MRIGSTATVSTLCLAMFLANANAQEVAQSDSTVTFPSGYFSEYAPLTVNDMVNRIPGIELILGGGSSSSSDRGLGSSAQILIDGKRLAGKANEASNQLDRIASQRTRSTIFRLSVAALATSTCRIADRS